MRGFMLPPDAKMHGGRTNEGDYRKLMRMIEADRETIARLEQRIAELEDKERRRGGRPRKEAA